MAHWRRFQEAETPWLTALHAAGLTPAPGRHGGRGSSDDAFHLGLALAVAERREWPSADQYRAVDGSPSVQSIYDRFGTWGAAREWCNNHGWRVSRMGRKFPIAWKRFLTKVLQWATTETESHTLTANRYRDLRMRQPACYSWPSVSTLQRCFETWNQAKQAAELPRHKHEVSIPKSEAIEAVRAVSSSVNGALTTQVYEARRGPDQPSLWQIAKRYGWRNIKQEAGIITENDRAARSPLTEQLAIQSVCEVAARADTILTLERYDDLRDDDKHPHGVEIAKTYGWNDLKEKAGLDVAQPRRSKQEAIEAIQTVAQRVDGPLSMSKYDTYRDNNHPCSSTLTQRFGWKNLKEEGEIDCGSDTIKRESQEHDTPPTNQ